MFTNPLDYHWLAESTKASGFIFQENEDGIETGSDLQSIWIIVCSLSFALLYLYLGLGIQLLLRGNRVY